MFNTLKPQNAIAIGKSPEGLEVTFRHCKKIETRTLKGNEANRFLLKALNKDIEPYRKWKQGNNPTWNIDHGLILNRMFNNGGISAKDLNNAHNELNDSTLLKSVVGKSMILAGSILVVFSPALDFIEQKTHIGKAIQNFLFENPDPMIDKAYLFIAVLGTTAAWYVGSLLRSTIKRTADMKRNALNLKELEEANDFLNKVKNSLKS